MYTPLTRLIMNPYGNMLYNKPILFYSGDRFVYVKGKFTTALHTIGLINFHKCRIWHQSQARACIRCRQLDHTSTDTESCPAYTGDTNIIMIRSANYAMCNYYMCNLRVFEMDFRSSEQAYQWRFMKYLGMDDLAQEIFEAKTPEEAKEIASRVPSHMHKDWHSIKLCIMKEIIHAKADYCNQFKSALKESVGKRLVECTQDMYWASGLPPRYTLATKPEYYPGGNKLGQVLESVRFDLIRESLMEDLLDSDTVPLSPVPLLCDIVNSEVPPPPPSSPPPQFRDTNTEIDNESQTNDHTLLSPSHSPPPTPGVETVDPIESVSQSADGHNSDSDSDCILKSVPSFDLAIDDANKKSGIRNIRKAKTVRASSSKPKGKASKPDVTITSIFDAMKRKRSPGKDADPLEESQKLHCGDEQNT